jgi:hypothetical protein
VATTVFPEFSVAAVAVAFELVGVIKITGPSVVGTDGSFRVGVIADSPGKTSVGKTSVEMAGSVPRKIYLKGVAVAVMGAMAREVT